MVRQYMIGMSTFVMGALFFSLFGGVCHGGGGTKESITLFVHGLGGNERSIIYYKKYGYVENNAYSFKLYNDISQVSLGQHNETNRLDKAMCFVKSKRPEQPLVLRGVSMGASTIINRLGLGEYDTNTIKGIILESPFADIIDVIDDVIQKSKVLRILNVGCPYFFKSGVMRCFYPRHTLTGMQPIKTIKGLHEHHPSLPILFIASVDDTLVPTHSTIRLYKALVAAGHKQCHLLLVKGEHAKICWGVEGIKIRNVEHAFRKKYGLGNYNNEYALAGNDDFNKTQLMHSMSN